MKNGHRTPLTGIIGGTSLMSSPLFSSWRTEEVKTAYGAIQIKRRGETFFLQRHGNPPLPPHRMNHRANIRAMKDLGVGRIIAINSVGSLKTSIRPGSLLIPDDFISLWQSITFFDDEMRFMVPSMDPGLAKSLYQLCTENGLKVRTGGTYIQTTGPRLETKAEIRMLRAYGHVIGMTMASEATLSMESGIPYASLCSIDNYCNGIVELPLTMEKIAENVAKNMKAVESIIETIISRGME